MFAPRISHTAGRQGQPRDAASSLQRHSPLAGAQARREDVPEDRQKQRSSGTGGGGLTGPFPPAAPIVPMPRPHAVRLQTKLRIGSTTDPLESDADRVADQVMRMRVTNIPSTGPNQIRRKCAQCQREDDALPSTPPQLQRKCAACEEEEAHLQKKPDHASESPSLRTEAPPLVHQVLRSPGQPLAKDELAFFTSRFGFDFSRVRIHNDRTAAESAHSVNALAYTAGSDIAFADGQYQPGTESGRRLIAHELTHVVQQGSAARTRGDATLGVQRDNAGNALRRAPGCEDLMDPRLKESAKVSEREVQDALIAQIPNSRKELPVPDSSFTAQRMGKKYLPWVLGTGAGRVDIFVTNPPVMEVMELKHGDSPIKLADGLGQMRNYVEVGNDYGNDDWRARLGVKRLVPMPPSRYPSSHIRAGAADEPVTLRWCVPGLLAYRALRDQDRDLFVCTARDQGKVDAFLNGKLTRGWDVVDNYIDNTVGPKIEAAVTSMSISDLVQKLLSNPAGKKLLEKALPGSSILLDGIDGKLVGEAAAALLKDFAVQIRAVAMDFKRKLIDQARQAMRDKMHDLLQAELNALCATATVLTMAEILAKLNEKMPKLFMDEVAVLVPVIATAMLKELLAEAALALVEAIALLCGVILGLIAAYLAAAALAAIEVGAMIEAGIAAAIRAMVALLPSFAAASAVPPPAAQTETPATAVV